MHIAVLTVELHIPGIRSLKEKRSRLKPLLAGLHRKFNISAAEIGANDQHEFAVIGCVVVSNDQRHAQQVLAHIPAWIEDRRPDMQIVDDHIELY
jgi:uncharacterized protein